MEREHLEAEMAVDEEILEIEIDAVLVEEEGLETGTENAIVASEVVVDVLMEAITGTKLVEYFQINISFTQIRIKFFLVRVLCVH